MNEQELNKKLGEWRFPEAEGITVVSGNRITIYHNAAKNPDYCWSTDYFTQSLDACFKWLVPKLKGYSLSKPAFLGVCVAIVYIDDSSFEGVDLDPALAFCLAIEKLIDGEK